MTNLKNELTFCETEGW